MGIGVVLIFWAILGGIAAVGGALVLVPLVRCLTPEVSVPEQIRSRKLLLWATAAFPFVCLAWGGVVFVGQAVVNVVFLNRDIGLGDGFDCPLPNGYELSFIDTVDIGTLYEPNSRYVADYNSGAIHGVKELQLTDRYMLGALEGSETLKEPPSYFLVDVKTRKRSNFESKAELNDAAAAAGMKLALEPAADLYYRYRPSWFDLFALAVLIVPPLVAGVLLIRWVVRLRRSTSIVVAAG